MNSAQAGLTVEEVEALVRQAQPLPFDAQPEYIAHQAFRRGLGAGAALQRQADANISPQELEAMYRVWWSQSHPGMAPNNQAVAMAVSWSQHLLSVDRRHRG